jgi:glycosyltransferase involved in cell wall biosynthesis/GT2 family glycosyltransferase
MTDFPFITTVMPVRNEARFIADTVGQLLSQDYPNDRFEILVIDGMSDDGTRDIVARIAEEDGRVRLLDNLKRRSSAGRNVGFRVGRGNYFVVVDGHCFIPDDQFLHNIATCFETSGADCLGRPQPLDPSGLSPFQKTVALARASRLGHGGDSLIYGDYEGFASPVSNGAAYRREVFEKVGYVDEDFDACEDVEFNYRVEQAGLKAYTSPKLTVRYFPRENLSALVSQMRRYGRGRTRLYRKHPALLSLSALVPACFAGGAAAFVALLILNLIFGLSTFLTFIFSALGLALLAYAVLVGVTAVRICREHGWSQTWRLPLIFLVVHGGLGLGMWEEFLAPVGRCLRRHRRSDGPIRIAFLIDAILSPTGGTERQLLLLLEGLDRKVFEPHLCVFRNTPWTHEHFTLCPLHDLKIGSLKSFAAWTNIIRFAFWLRKENIDIVQAHFMDSSLMGIPFAWMARVPGVIAMRKSQGYWMTGKPHFVQKFMNMLPDIFVANSESTRQWSHRTEGITLDRIRVIHNGFVEHGIPRDDASRIRARALLGLPGEALVVGIVANLRPVKRIDVFLRAAALVQGEMPGTFFVIVGEGDELPDLQELAMTLGLRDKVLFLGGRKDVAMLLPAFDVGILSSDSESFSNAVVEYMAAGLPVAATDVGGCQEALKGSPAGILVPPGDDAGLGRAILRLLNDDTVRDHAKIDHPRRVQEKFSSTLYLSAYESLYQDLMSARRRE